MASPVRRAESSRRTPPAPRRATLSRGRMEPGLPLGAGRCAPPPPVGCRSGGLMERVAAMAPADPRACALTGRLRSRSAGGLHAPQAKYKRWYVR